MYRLVSSPEPHLPAAGVPVLGNGYPALGGKMLLVVLVRLDTGDSRDRRKRDESPPRGPGDGWVCMPIWV